MDIVTSASPVLRIPTASRLDCIHARLVPRVTIRARFLPHVLPAQLVYTRSQVNRVPLAMQGRIAHPREEYRLAWCARRAFILLARRPRARRVPQACIRFGVGRVAFAPLIRTALKKARLRVHNVPRALTLGRARRLARLALHGSWDGRRVLTTATTPPARPCVHQAITMYAA